jgi:hypothetical protein
LEPYDAELNQRYWKMAPGGLRWNYRIDHVPAGNEEITIATISKDDKNWERIFTFPNLEELTLHSPNQKQLAAISSLSSLVRLRICGARPKDLGFISGMTNLGELVLEYVSGFSDLAPLTSLTRLRSLCLENLRGVSDFEGLSGLASLEYLKIDGTLDWNQPISNVEFLKGLAKLEALRLGFVINKSPFPALLPVMSLKNLKFLRIGTGTFATKEYALLEAGLPEVNGAKWKPSRRHAYKSLPVPPDDPRISLPADVIKAGHPTIFISHSGERLMDDPDSYWYDFLGKGVRSIKCSSPNAENRRIEFDRQYELMKTDARKLLDASGLLP